MGAEEGRGRDGSVGEVEGKGGGYILGLIPRDKPHSSTFACADKWSKETVFAYMTFQPYTHIHWSYMYMLFFDYM